MWQLSNGKIITKKQKTIDITQVEIKTKHGRRVNLKKMWYRSERKKVKDDKMRIENKGEKIVENFVSCDIDSCFIHVIDEGCEAVR